MRKKILLVIRNKKVSNSLFSFLYQIGYQVKICDQKDQLNTIVSIFDPDLILYESGFGISSSSGMATQLKQEKNNTPFILLLPSNINEDTQKQMVLDSSCDDFLIQPFNQTELYGKVTQLIEADDLSSTIISQRNGSEQQNEKIKKRLKQEIIKGVVNCKSVGGLLFTLLRMKKSGDLLVKRNKGKLRARLRNGQLIDVFSTYIREDSFGHFLMDLRRISLKEHINAYKESREKKLFEGEILVRMDILSRQELWDYLSRHKLKKFMRLFSESWQKADFRFLPNQETIRNVTMEPYHINKLLRLGLFKVAQSGDLIDAFELDRNKSRQVLVDEQVDNIASLLNFDQEELEIARWLNAKSITDIKKFYPDRYDRVLRMLLLMMVCKVASIKEQESISTL